MYQSFVVSNHDSHSTDWYCLNPNVGTNAKTWSNTPGLCFSSPHDLDTLPKME